MLIGLTGPSGAGKSTVASLFESAGFRRIDCDALVHTLGGTPAYVGAVARTFGDAFVRDGAIDRRALGALVFRDQTALARLNEAVAPLISAALEPMLADARESGTDTVLDAPLLFEYALERRCDCTVGVIASERTLLRRLSLRDSIPEEELRGRLASQRSNDDFAARCDYILTNDGDLPALTAAFAAMLCAIRREHAKGEKS